MDIDNDFGIGMLIRNINYQHHIFSTRDALLKKWCIL